jgi:peptidoglycan/LPS O-acetylase OafA/YrhL
MHSAEHSNLPLEARIQERLTAPSTHSATALRHYIPALDGVRGLAILVVMLCHFVWVVSDVGQGGVAAPDKVSKLGVELLKTGRYGVDLFFVLSGFLITGILLDSKNDSHYFRNFYARRTLRIFPLYYAVLAIVFVVMPLFVTWSAAEQQAVDSQWWLWTYLGNIKNSFWSPDFFQQERLWLGHLWSLAIEEQFYLVWPAVILLLSRTAAIRLCAAMIVGAFLVRLGFMLIWPGERGLFVALYFTFSKLDTLALGAFFAFAARSERGLSSFGRIAPWAFLCTGLMLAPLVLLKYNKESMFGAFAESSKLAIICFFCGSLLVMAVHSNGRGLVGWLFTTAFMRFLGKYSYGIYIFHELLAPLFNGPLGIRSLSPKLGGSWHLALAVHMALAFVITIGLAMVSWNLLEKHMLKLKRFFEHESASLKPAPVMAGGHAGFPGVDSAGASARQPEFQRAS